MSTRQHSVGQIGGNGAAGSTFAEAKAALLAIAEQAQELQQAVGGSVTDTVAGWLAPHYALAAQEQLAELEGEDRLKLLRAFVQDWALLRHGDQTAERLRIERERLAAVTLNAELKWKRKTIIGLEVFLSQVKKNPKAKAAFDALAEELRHPFDLSEQNLGNSLDSESD